MYPFHTPQSWRMVADLFSLEIYLDPVFEGTSLFAAATTLLVQAFIDRFFSSDVR